MRLDKVRRRSSSVELPRSYEVPDEFYDSDQALELTYGLTMGNGLETTPLRVAGVDSQKTKSDYLGDEIKTGVCESLDLLERGLDNIFDIDGSIQSDNDWGYAQIEDGHSDDLEDVEDHTEHGRSAEFLSSPDIDDSGTFQFSFRAPSPARAKRFLQRPVQQGRRLEHITSSISTSDLQRLDNGGWLNDKLVNFYLLDWLAPRYGYT